jgi:hypothetical protein
VNVFGLIAPLWLVAGLETAVPAPKAEILGLWKGTSTCTKVDLNEFCRDETVVYNFVDVPEQPGTIELKAARIIDNSLKPMYTLFFTYRPTEGRWTSAFERPQVRGIWAYAVHGGDMTGTATVLPSLTVVRNVEAKRVSKDQVLAH